MGKLKKATGSKVFQLLVIWVVLYAIFSVITSIKGTATPFLSGKTLLEVADLMIVTSFLAIGSAFLLVTGNMDLSASAIGAFANVFFMAAMAYWGWNPVLSLIVTIVASAAFGIANGVLVNEFNCPTFIVTMAMGFVAKGFMQWVSIDPDTGLSGTVSYYNAFSKWIATTKIGPFSIILFLAVVAFIIYGIILSKTQFGMQMYLVGSNPMASNLCGINSKKVIYILFANSAALAAVSGVIYACRASQGDLNALMNNQFTGMTAAILGGVSFGGGNGNMAGVFIGLLILNTFTKGMLAMGSSSYFTTVLTGVLLLVALIIDAYSIQKARKSVK